MPRTSKNFFALLHLLTLLTSCGASKEKPKNVVPEDHAEPVTGELATSFMPLQDSKFRDACERKYATAQLELLQALDERATEIEVETAKHIDVENWKVVPLGSKFFAREQKNKPTPKNEWRMREDSWEPIIAAYQKIKNQPMGADWVSLNEEAKGMLSDDLERWESPFLNSWHHLSREDRVPLRLLSEALQACEGDSACGKPALTEEMAQVAARLPLIRDSLLKLQGAEKLEEQRKALTEVAEHVADLRKRFAMRVNPTAKRISENEIRVPMNGTAFSDALAQIASYIESLWTSEALAIKVEFVSEPAGSEVFKMFAEPGVGARAYVNFKDRSMHLYNYVSDRTVAHEFGHVLGFRDQYYSTWVPEKCLYEFTFNRANLLSNTTNGYVTGEQWEALNELYPLTKN